MSVFRSARERLSGYVQGLSGLYLSDGPPRGPFLTNAVGNDCAVGVNPHGCSVFLIKGVPEWYAFDRRFAWLRERRLPLSEAGSRF